MAEINLLTDLFLCPVAYDEDTCDENGHPIALPEDDMELHFTKSAAEKIAEGAHIVLTDAIPNTYSPAKTADKGILHFRKIDAPDGKSYIPLFVSFAALTGIFGSKVHIGVVCFEEAKNLCLTENNLEGIVVGPGQINKIITKDSLANM